MPCNSKQRRIGRTRTSSDSSHGCQNIRGSSHRAQDAASCCAIQCYGSHQPASDLCAHMLSLIMCPNFESFFVISKSLALAPGRLNLLKILCRHHGRGEDFRGQRGELQQAVQCEHQGRAVWPEVRRQRHERRAGTRGTILVESSVLSHEVRSSFTLTKGLYGASKAANDVLIKYAAGEYADAGAPSQTLDTYM